MTQEIKILSGIGVITVAILVGAIFFLSKSPDSSSNTPINNPVSLVKQDSHKIATDSAKVTIVEFGDYQCPACSSVQPVVKQILKDYSGKINFVFRHFPLPQHQNAMTAAAAAEAAGEQEKYWEMHDKLYDNQDAWAKSNNPKEIFTTYAQQLNLNIEEFKNSVNSSKYNQRITDDKNDGISLGVNSTPTFYINGSKINNFSYSEFKNRIDEASR